MYAKVPGAFLRCIERGHPAGHPVLFIHGFPLSSDMWTPQLDAVAPAYRAIAYDLRGHGHSSVGAGPYSIEGHVDDLVALLDHLEIDRVVGVGFSMGGYVLLRALEREARRFSAAVLCDTRSGADDDAGKVKRATSAASIVREGHGPFLDGFLPAALAPSTLTDRRRVVEKVRQMVLATSPASMAGHQMAMAARTDTTGTLAAIGVPCLILVGEDDAITPVEVARDMQGRVPGAQLAVVPHAGHMSNLENPSAFNDRLLGFLARLDR